jgi:hypothetical protein
MAAATSASMFVVPRSLGLQRFRTAGFVARLRFTVLASASSGEAFLLSFAVLIRASNVLRHL